MVPHLPNVQASSLDAQPQQPTFMTDVLQGMQAVNEQLVLVGLREQALTDQLRRQLAFINAITASLGEGVYVLDMAGCCSFINPAAERMLGWTGADLCGKPIETILPVPAAVDATSPTVAAMLLDVLHSGTTHRDDNAILVDRDGSAFPIAYVATPISSDGQVGGAVITFRDMTERRAATNALQQAHDVLVDRVRKRTSELEYANSKLQTEIDQRAHTEQARQRLLQQLVTAQEEERRRIARELHDQMGQSVTALMLAIKVLHDRVTEESILQQSVAQLHALGSQLGHDVRTLAVQLRPPALDDFGLLPTLTTYLQHWSTQALVAVDFHSSGLEGARLPQLIETTIFRVVQEALTNIARHAQASSASVILHRRADTIQMIVEDDGIGFDPQVERQRPPAERRLGLLGIEERITQLAGTLTIESTPGNGIALFVALPLARAVEKGPA